MNQRDLDIKIKRDEKELFEMHAKGSCPSDISKMQSHLRSLKSFGEGIEFYGFPYKEKLE